MPFRPLSFAVLLAAVFLLVTGNGIMSTLIPYRAKLEGFPDLVIGLVGSSFYAGMLGGAAVAPGLVRRLGHRGGFIASCLAGVAGALLLPSVIHPVVWIVGRFAIGFSLTGLYAILESWLSAASDDRTRGRALGICSVAQYAAWAAGSLIFAHVDTTGFVQFGLAAILFVSAIPPFLLIRETPPVPPQKSSLDLLWFFRSAPSSFVAGLLTGAANGPMFALSPLFGTEIGLSTVAIGTMMSIFTGGSVAFQIPVGWLSDRVDRRRLLAGLATVSALAELFLGASGSVLAIGAVYATAFVIEAANAVQYYVAVAHAVDRCGRAQAVMVMSCMVVLYGVGAIAGPPIASVLMSAAGPSALYLYQCAMHLALAAFVARQILRRGSPTATARR